MQINNWSDLLKSKRLAKTPRDLNNDLIIIGTNTAGSFKKQDTWQPYAMTLADLATAIGGGGGGVSFQLLADGYTELFEKVEGSPNFVPRSSAFTPGENSTIKVSTISIPNGLNWRGSWNIATSNYVYNDVVSYVDPETNVYYTYWMYNDTATPPAGFNLPIMDDASSNTYWAQLGLQGPKGTTGYRTAYISLYQWSNATPTVFPVGTSDYTWADGTFTTDSVTLNSWTQSVGAPTPGQTLYKISLFISNNDTTADTTGLDWANYIGPDSIGYAGANGSTSVGGFFTRLGTGDTSYTLQAADNGKVIFADNINDAIITIPNLSDLNYGIGSQTMIIKRANAGKVTIVNGSGVTVQSADNMTRLRSIGSGATVLKETTTQWYLFGDLVSSLL